MKKIIGSLVFIVLMNSVSFAQQGPNGGGAAIGNLQGLKIAYITKELALTTDEAQKFWPIYYNFSDDLTAARRDKKDDVIGFDEKALVIKKKYYAEFKKVLGTDERANKVFLCEREFGNFIKKEIENRQKLRGMKQNRK